MSSRVKWFVLMLVVKLHHDFRDWLLLVAVCRFGSKIWLGVGPIRFINVINSDRPITIDRNDRNVCRDISSTVGLSNYVVLCD